MRRAVGVLLGQPARLGQGLLACHGAIVRPASKVLLMSSGPRSVKIGDNERGGWSSERPRRPGEAERPPRQADVSVRGRVLSPSDALRYSPGSLLLVACADAGDARLLLRARDRGPERAALARQGPRAARGARRRGRDRGEGPGAARRGREEAARRGPHGRDRARGARRGGARALRADGARVEPPAPPDPRSRRARTRSPRTTAPRSASCAPGSTRAASGRRASSRRCGSAGRRCPR